MFDRFYRADPSRSSVAGGAGLGLAISRELAMAQSGQLKAATENGQVVMRLSLPAVVERTATTEPQARAPVRLRTHPEARA
jgi:signal transduction histidine kinase